MPTAESHDEAIVGVALLGGLRVSAADAVLDGRELGRRAVVSFARLALDAGVTLSREDLADAVWGDARPAPWRAALRNVITELRRALARSGLNGRVSLQAGADGYALLLPAGSTVDVVRLRAQAEDADGGLREADYALVSELTARELVDATRVVLPGGDEQWVDGLRAEVHGLRLRLAFAKAHAALEIGDPTRAEAIASELVQAARLREDFHRLQIVSLRAAGRRAEALLAYDTYRRLLADELGALPSPATQQLFLDILAEERDERPVPPFQTGRGSGSRAAAGDERTDPVRRPRGAGVGPDRPARAGALRGRAGHVHQRRARTWEDTAGGRAVRARAQHRDERPLRTRRRTSGSTVRSLARTPGRRVDGTPG
jgi:DNA-binding SARP family transcriptional activator